tara:strand:+ start:45 stop:266 length:222 start_codon:yes stop_codon:yes gene_type:complete
MMNFLLYLLFISFVLPVYNVGETITDTDQNIVLNVCDQTNEYNVGDQVRMSDWNGAVNGGDYHVIWLEMSASW